MQHNGTAAFDRLIAVGSYLTFGTIGMIWFILNAVFLKKPMSKYLAYNLIQSLILSILYAILTLAYTIFIDLLTKIPFIGGLFMRLDIFLFGTPIFHTFSLVNFIIVLFLCYLAIISAFGKLPEVPYITDIAKGLY